MKRSNY